MRNYKPDFAIFKFEYYLLIWFLQNRLEMVWSYFLYLHVLRDYIPTCQLKLHNLLNEDTSASFEWIKRSNKRKILLLVLVEIMQWHLRHKARVIFHQNLENYIVTRYRTCILYSFHTARNPYSSSSTTETHIIQHITCAWVM